MGKTYAFQHGTGIGQHIGTTGTAYQGRHGHVFQGREFRQEMMELKHEAQRPVAEAGLFVRPHLGHVPAVKKDFSTAWSIKSPHKMQEGTLAGAGGCPKISLS